MIDSKEEFWEEYENLPEIIKDNLFSEENYDIISEICDANGLADENSKSQLMKYVGKTLIGKLPIKDFIVTIELEMELDAEVAKEISKEIDKRIFSHLRIALNKIYSDSKVDNKVDLSNNKKTERIIPTPKSDTHPKDPYKESLI